MKNFIEIPKKEDYHNTTFVDTQAAQGREPQHEKELNLYHKGRINLRSIVDLHEFIVKIEVIDEEKFPQWEKQRDEWREKQKARACELPQIPQDMVVVEPGAERMMGDVFPSYTPPPPVPTTIKNIKVTTILYFSGVQRFIMDDFSDFCEVYDNYLTKQKLDY